MASEATKIPFVEAAAPGTPAASRVVIYAKADGLMYSKDDAGAETLMSGGAGGLTDHDHTGGGDGGDLDAPVIDGYAVFNEEAAPGSAGAATVRLYAKSDGLLYSKDDAGTETLVSGGAGGGSVTAAAYKRSSANYTTTSQTFGDVDGTNFSLTITTGAHRVQIGFVGTANSGAASEITAFDVTVDGTRQGGDLGLVWCRSTDDENVSFVYLTDVLTAASHTFKLQWRNNGGNTSTIRGVTSGSANAQFWVLETLATT